MKKIVAWLREFWDWLVVACFVMAALTFTSAPSARAQGLPSAGPLAARPAACPQSALYYFATDTLALYVSSNPSPTSCAWLYAGSGQNVGPVFNILNYGGVGDLRTCTASVTSGSKAVTGAGASPCAFAAADVGKIAWVMNPSTNAAICGSQTVSESVVSQTGTTATLTNNCTATLATTALLYIGTDDIAATQALASAVIAANGGRMYVPSGNYALGGPTTGSAIAINVTNGVKGTVSLIGNGAFNSVFYPAPWIRTSNTISGDVFSFDNQSAAVLEDWGMNLYNFAKSNDQGFGAVAAQYPQVDRIAIVNDNWSLSTAAFASDPTAALGLATWFNYSVARSVQQSSVYWSNGNFSSAASSGFDLVADALAGPVLIEWLYPGTVNILHGLLLANTFGEGVNSTTVASGSGEAGTVNVTGMQFCSNGFSGSVLYDMGPGTGMSFHLTGVTIDSASCPTPGTNVTDVESDAAGLVSVQNSTMPANGTGYNFNLASGAVAVNGLDNSFSGGAGTSTGSGVIASQSSEAGTVTCSGSAATITFKGAYPKAPFYTIQDRTTTNLPVTQTSESAAALVVGCPGASDVLNYTVTPNL